ncbi:MAG: sulfurtransferase TusA family protein [Candidatus Bathyarchaeia archaeon]
MTESDRKLDLIGDVCPYPVIYTLRELEKMRDGQILEVVTDHLPAVENVPASAEGRGHEVFEVTEMGSGVYRILIKVKVP